MKTKPQNVKYDLATGKMYEELGASSASNGNNGGSGNSGGMGDASGGGSSYLGYHQNYGTASNYPYGQSAMSQVQYMGSFTGGYGTSTSAVNPYDR